MDPGHRRALSDGRRRRVGAAAGADDFSGRAGRAVVMEVHRETRAGILRALAAVAGIRARRFQFDGSVFVLPVL